MRKYAILIALTAGIFAAAASLTLTTAAEKAAPRAQERPGKPIAVHVANGMWSQHWKLTGALARPKGKYAVSESFATQRYNWVHALKYFPEKKEKLQANKVLILGNINFTAFERKGPRTNMQAVPGRSDKWVEQFVKRGGGVLILGGNVSFGLSSPARKFSASSLSKIVPAKVGDEADMDVKTQNRPFALTPVGKHPILKSLDWKDRPVTLFYHRVKPTRESTVLVRAGGAPVMILGTYPCS